MTHDLVRYSVATAGAVALVLWMVPVRVATQEEGGAAAARGGRGGGAQQEGGARGGARGGAQAADANAPTPRMPDGHADLSGRWGGGGGDGGGVKVKLPDGTQASFRSYEEYENALAHEQVNPRGVVVGRQTNYRHDNNDYSGKDEALQHRYTGNPPLYKPEFWEKVQHLDTNGNKEDTSFACLPGGVPRMGPPSRILQTANDLVFLYNTNNFLNVFDWRVVPTDGRPHHPVYSKDQTFMGDSVGHWEGDTLVVDVLGLNDLTWLGWPGWFHTTDMHVIEKFRREGNQLHYDVTVEDPAVLLEPWVIDHRVIRLNPSTVYTEDPPCIEADLAHIVKRLR